MGQYSGKYWRAEHEELCKQWVTANTKQEYHIYNLLHGTIWSMANMILHRYFYCPFSKNLETTESAVDFLFLKLRAYQPEKGKAYSYCQTVIKNFFIDVLMSKPNQNQNQMDKLENRYELDAEYLDGRYRSTNYNDGADRLEHFFTITDDEELEEVEVDEIRQKLIVRFTRNEFALERKKIQSSRRVWLLKSKNIIRRRQYIKLLIRFLTEVHAHDINANIMAEWIFNHSFLLKETTVVNLTKEITGKYNYITLDLAQYTLVLKAKI